MVSDTKTFIHYSHTMKRAIPYLVIFISLVSLNLKAEGTTSELRAGNGQRCEIIFYTPEIVRVVKYSPDAPDSTLHESLAVTLKPGNFRIKRSETPGWLVLDSDVLRVRINKDNGRTEFSTLSGKHLLSEKDGAEISLIESGADKGDYRVAQCFMVDDDEVIYGLGQHQDGKLSRRNMKKRLIQGNQEDVVPFIHSVKGYGLFWDNYSPTVFEDSDNVTLFDSEVGECVDYYFMYGGDADGVIARMRELTGSVPMFPLWTYGFFQSKERYKSQDEIVGVVARYRELGVPLDGIVQDWQYWGNNYLWNAMDFLNENYRDPQKMVDDIHGLNAKVIISVWPSFGPMTKPYRELDEKGLLFDFATWPQSGSGIWPPKMEYPSNVKVYNPYMKEARDIYWKYLDRGIMSIGMDGVWMDGTEPDHFEPKKEDFDLPTGMGSFRKMRNAFPLMTVGGVYENQRLKSSDKRVFILTRSVFAGQQRYGCNIWTGDIQANWDVLRNQIPAGLNLSLCGIPHWNTDIGGFFLWGRYPRRLADDECKELHVRWAQFGTFCPMMRSHGEGAAREIYQLGKKGTPYYDAYEKYIRLRYSLLPYIYSTSWDVTSNNSSFLRALFMDFPNDGNVKECSDEYMFGKAFLVCPVTEPMYSVQTGDLRKGDFSKVKSSEVYLPAGSVWYDFWTNEKTDGGKTIVRETPLDIIPLYVKGGSIVPYGPDVQYSTERQWDFLEITVYPGSDGEFTLYEDEFDNYNYEKGSYSAIPMKWDDSKRTLTICRREGKGYNGMIGERIFRVKTADGKSCNVVYSGQSKTVKL